VEIHGKYEGYIAREKRAAEKAMEMESKTLPDDLDYWKMAGLRREAKEKLSRVMPTSIGQASRVPGITPADVSVVLIAINRRLVTAQVAWVRPVLPSSGIGPPR
jgi:tRNA uridine 5-carboxymethylaminomethyl modification enzyme